MPLLCFTSPKGGVGKTFLSANVAGILARAGRRVIALDLDPQNALRFHFGVPLEDANGFTTGLATLPDWRRTLRATPSGVHLLAYGQADGMRTVELSALIQGDPTLLTQPLRQMLRDPDVIVVADTMPGASPALLAILGMADLVITVLHPNGASLALVPAVEAGAAYGSLFGHNGPKRAQLAYVLNQVDPRVPLARRITQMVLERFGPRLLGVVHRDEIVGEALVQQMLVTDYSPASKVSIDVAALTRAIASTLQRTPEMAGACSP